MTLPQTVETACGSPSSREEDRHEYDDQTLQEDSVKKKKKYVSDSPSEVLRVGATTLVLQNLPRLLRQSTLLKAIDDTLRPGLYDFCYMPMCFKTNECVGHAFINFVSPQVAAALVLAWDRSTELWLGKKGAKPMALQVAKYQGLSDLLSLSCMKKAHRIRNQEFRPYVAPAVELTAMAGSQQQAPDFEVTLSL
eukprot:CAMPEP_0178404230 /NCGR_PEP_ID=MMETSP0689_2-20121128/17775_1 /TAXON_ID=160604 /ORGANISM="Amphidinium massartii, Strain CS-259" /LENGTH=193 /DNA_ID=CAMNT_0020025205 /DNA_START=143 /DNA_END=724 /DNA_ORIENTATION=-